VATGLFHLVGLALIGGAALVTAGFGLWIRRRLGGVTGDGLGAAVELLEVATLLLVLALAVK
jgi:adenosylcobinamide-GDP ribazoletransferase